ncbi:hypothetical protein Tco_0122232 [Tanacetum coccineum]
MTTLQFADTHNLVAFLAKPTESEGFEQVVDFLNAHTIKYALTVNPTIYTLCIEQFWPTVKVKTANGEQQLQALVDRKKIVITEASIRRDLQLDDDEGTDCLPNATIFEELTRMGYEKLSQKLTFYKAFFSPQWKFLIHTILQCLSAKTTTWNEFSSIMASAIICLATNQKFNFSKVGRSARVVSSEEASLGDQEDASKQGRKINDIDADAGITLDSTHFDADIDMFRVHDLDGDEVVTTATTTTTKGILLQEPSESITTTTIPLKDKGKEAIRLQAEFDKEVRLAKEKYEANVALIEEWNDIQAKIDADYQMAKQMQAEEQEGNMAGWKPKDLKNKSFANIQELFDKAMKRVSTFVDMDTDLVEGSEVKAKGSERIEESSSKRAGDELE